MNSLSEELMEDAPVEEPLTDLIEAKKTRINDLLRLFAQVKRAELSESGIKNMLYSSKMLIATEEQSLQYFKSKSDIAVVLRAYVNMMKMMKLAGSIQKFGNACRRVFRNLRVFVFHTKVMRQIDKRKIDKRMLTWSPKAQNFNANFIDELRAAGLGGLDFKLIKKSNNPVAVVKPQIYHQNLFAELLDAKFTNYESLSKSFVEVFTQIQSKLDGISQIVVESSCIIIITIRNNIYLLSTTQNKVVTFKSPVKILRINFYGEFLVMLEENYTLRFMHIDFGDPNESNNLEQSLSPIPDEELETDGILKKWRVNDFVVRGSAIAVSSLCHKVSYKQDLDQQDKLPKVFKFKRKIGQMCLGLNFFLALDDSGVLYSYGDNDRGQLGIGNDKPSETLNLVESIAKQKEIIRSFSCGDAHCCATSATGKVYIWGDNSKYQLGTSNQNCLKKITAPKRINCPATSRLGKEKRTQVKCGKNSTYILYLAKKLIYWGMTNCSTLIEEPVMKDLSEMYPARVFPINLQVQYSNQLEIVYIRSVDTRNTEMANKSSTIPIMTSLFDSFTKSNQRELTSHNALL